MNNGSGAARGHALVDPGRLLDVLGVESELLAACAHDQDPDLAVPSCPGLTVGETVRHVASSYRMVLAWLRDGYRPRTWREDPRPDESLTDFLRSGARRLLAELAAHEPDEPCPTWWPTEANYGFWRRRLVHETTVHRVDVQSALGQPLAPVADDVALDGVDEVLSLWFTHRLAVLGVTGPRRGSVAVRTGGRVWVARGGPDGTAGWRAAPEAGQVRVGGGADRPGGTDQSDVDRSDVDGQGPGSGAGEWVDAEVSGSPMDVYLWLWGRLPNRAVHVTGDDDAVAQLWALLRLATR
ncbi:maleylpyruvate isomerase family mycothiol-dependent enzyme [Goodfellowiella coeruleoviolacea]|uniref:TIGR03083 family protein n=1 Tax=Goodfellowiella coeruleoviolacea TaxID=334858 RepID=A0AAE3GFS1_9PSEU|nr:maleylpyruvate isomerase family mycothiol-dependent enzyme [Goodfellowiella coeruleoviolacea]MCP2165343.1 TIGR03083 family protein [Goodfellowiella coeruleoviolacea]